MKMDHWKRLGWFVAVLCLAVALTAMPCAGEEGGEEGEEPEQGQAAGDKDLAKESQNPLSTMISLPFQSNTNFGIGVHDRVQEVLNVQPVAPFSFEKVNLITRTIVPLMYQPDVTRSSGGE